MEPIHGNPGSSIPMLSRRRFVQGLALGGTAALLGAFAKPGRALAGGTQPRVLPGTEFKLEVVEMPVDCTGAARLATTVNGQLPGPLLRWREGTTGRRVNRRMICNLSRGSGSGSDGSRQLTCPLACRRM